MLSYDKRKSSFNDFWEIVTTLLNQLLYCGKLSDSKLYAPSVYYIEVHFTRVIIFRSQWYTNKHFRGTWSVRTLESERLGGKAAELAEPIPANGTPVSYSFLNHYIEILHCRLDKSINCSNSLTFRLISLTKKYYKKENKVSMPRDVVTARRQVLKYNNIHVSIWAN